MIILCRLYLIYNHIGYRRSFIVQPLRLGLLPLPEALTPMSPALLPDLQLHQPPWVLRFQPSRRRRPHHRLLRQLPSTPVVRIVRLVRVATTVVARLTAAGTLRLLSGTRRLDAVLPDITSVPRVRDAHHHHPSIFVSRARSTRSLGAFSSVAQGSERRLLWKKTFVAKCWNFNFINCVS